MILGNDATLHWCQFLMRLAPLWTYWLGSWLEHKWLAWAMIRHKIKLRFNMQANKLRRMLHKRSCLFKSRSKWQVRGKVFCIFTGAGICRWLHHTKSSGVTVLKVQVLSGPQAQRQFLIKLESQTDGQQLRQGLHTNQHLQVGCMPILWAAKVFCSSQFSY